jgi:hypothetical protein
MKKTKVLVDKDYIDRQTYWANREADDLIKSTSNFQNDSESESRLKLQLCKRCFYLRKGSIACQAFCDQDCGICGKTNTFSSSETDVLCFPCSKAHELCIKCGCNLNMISLKNKKTP